MSLNGERPVRNIRLLLSYDGTELHGFQRQKNGASVQQWLEEALTKVCNEPITIYGSSRTDAGVHAKYQVVAFSTTGQILVENLLRALIAHIPPYIVVWDAQEIPLDWKPRGNIWGKQYVYTIWNHMVDNPLQQRYHWHVKKPLDLEAMRQAGRALEGTRDFSTLKGKNTTPADPVKTIYAVSVEADGPTVKIAVAGDGFLYHMVRNIAGLLVDVGLGRIPIERIPALLAAKDRSCIGKTAPPQGLCLEEVFLSEERMHTVVSHMRRLHHDNAR